MDRALQPSPGSLEAAISALVAGTLSSTQASFDGGGEWGNAACPAVQLLVGHKARPADSENVTEAGSVAAPGRRWRPGLTDRE